MYPLYINFSYRICRNALPTSRGSFSRKCYKPRNNLFKPMKMTLEGTYPSCAINNPYYCDDFWPLQNNSFIREAYFSFLLRQTDTTRRNLDFSQFSEDRSRCTGSGTILTTVWYKIQKWEVLVSQQIISKLQVYIISKVLKPKQRWGFMYSFFCFQLFFSGDNCSEEIDRAPGIPLFL